MKRTKEDAMKTRQDILNAAINIFNQKGYKAARLEDIARLAGTTRGAIYWHFKNKQDLFGELIKEVMGEFVEKVKEIFQTDNALLDKLYIVFGLFDVMDEDEVLKLIFLTNILFSLTYTKDMAPAFEVAGQIHDEIIDVIVKDIKRAEKAGEIRAIKNHESLATIIMHCALMFTEKMSHEYLSKEFKEMKNLVTLDNNQLREILFNGFNSLEK